MYFIFLVYFGGFCDVLIGFQGASSALLATLEKERELLRIFLRVSQMENTILRRMNLSSFLMVNTFLIFFLPIIGPFSRVY